MNIQTHKKALLCGAFLLSALLSFVTSHSAIADGCLPCRGKLYKVSRIVDGDTLVLKNSQRIRLIGINTPELGHQGGKDQPGARVARDYLQKLVDRSGGLIHICSGKERQDRYGRQLAHISDRDGHNMARLLLQQGMGYAIAVPPNISNLTCYFDAESKARDAKLGVWATPLTNAAELRGKEAGFYHLEGRIVRVGQSRSAVWLNLEGGLALRITRKDWAAFKIDDPESLVGERLEVRGWIYQHKGAQRIRVRHPSAIQWLD
ncbi:MAG: thermonuclease family protein [Candidatus Thiodiazotropha sp.]